jgi:hypothetical protein
MDISQLTPAMLQKLPAMAPPPGHFTDFANPGHDGSNAHQTVVVSAVLTALTVVILLLRLYTKFVVIKAPGWDDCRCPNSRIGTYADLST